MWQNPAACSLSNFITVTRFATWFKAMITERIDANDRESDTLVRSESAKHRHALAQVLTWTVLVIVYFFTGVQIADRLGLPTSGLVARLRRQCQPSAFWGLQRLVQDLLAGFFIITGREKCNPGDTVSIGVPGIPSGVIGTVEDVTLRMTKVHA